MMFVPLTFWIVDASFRRVQRSLSSGTGDIATYLNSRAFLDAAQHEMPIDFPLMTMRNPHGEKMSWFDTMRFKTVAVLTC